MSALWVEFRPKPDHRRLQGPEVGLVMTQARAGGGGAPFNLGEASATRCAVALPGGEVGHGYALGRDKRKVEIAAVLDAMMQTDAAARIDAEILAPLREERAAREREATRRAAATRVEFFTMVRGEDE